LKLQLARAQALLNQQRPKTDEAMKILQPLVNKKNAPWPVYHYAGIAFLQKREYGTALSFLLEAKRQGADQPETFHSISICYFNTGDYENAEKYADIALKKNPDFFKAWLHLGAVYRAQAKLDEALKCFQKANQIDPRSAGVAYRIGEIYNDQGDMKKALELFNITLKIDEEYITAYLAKAEILKKERKFEEAEEVIRKALGFEPQNVGAQVSLAELYKYEGRYHDAIELYKKLIRKHPKVAGIRINYALCMQEIGRFDESEKNYLRAFEDQPETFESLSNYLMGLHYNPDHTKEEIFEKHKLWDQNFAPAERPARPVPFNTDRDKRLRLGFISGGFRTHPVGWMITSALENLPKDQFEIYCYTTNNRYDKITKRIHAVADRWQSVIGYNDEVIARMIKEDEIDILVELSGHSADTRLRTVAKEPAPVIVKWVGGLFNTTGLQSVDYLITDHQETPAGEEKFYTEKLVRMPDDYICFLPPDYAPEVAELPAKVNGYITFGCFNNPTKVNDEILARWASIMEIVPKSRLFLKSKQYDTPALRERIIEMMENCGITADRILFEGQSPHDELLECYNRVDIALDPWPYSGGLTTCEALWMGVPVISKPGPTFAGRHSVTHLHNAGFPEWIAETWEDYTEKIVELASDTEKLAEIRAGIRSKVADSPICDGRRFGAHLSKAFREMWKQRVEGYAKQLPEGEWQDHIEIKETAKDEYSRKDAMEQVKEIESEFINRETGEVVQKARNHANGHVNGNGHLTGGKALQATVEKPEVYKIETADGVTICTPPDLKMMTPYVLLEQNDWHERETIFIRDYLKAGMNVVDVGAGFGVYSLPAAKRVGKGGTVFSFEPGAAARKHLEMSKLENGFENLEVIGKAVSDKGGNHTWQEAQTPELSKLDEDGNEEVAAVTLDNWWQFEGEPNVDLVKIDVNGDEAKALAGAKTVLEKETPLLLISINEKNADTFAGNLNKQGYSLYEYIPGPGILAEHDIEAGTDPYIQNLIAIHESELKELKTAGWVHDESVVPQEVNPDLWRTELSKLPWTEELMCQWEKHGEPEGVSQYLQALNYLIAAEQIDIQSSELEQPRSQKAVLLLNAAQLLIGLYNQGANSTSVVFTLVRTMNALGKRSQAVEVMQKLIETTKLGQENMNVDLPFVLPIPEQDKAAIKTDLSKWLMVKTVEAWILLKDVSMYFSGEQERKLMEVLEGNVELSDSLKKINLINNRLKNLDLTSLEQKRFEDLTSKNVQPEPDFEKVTFLSKEKKEEPCSTHQIFNRMFWTEEFDAAKAKKVVEITQRFLSGEFDSDVLNQVVAETEKRRQVADEDNIAFFIQTHALLALNGEESIAGKISVDLKEALKRKNWESKSALYNYWFQRVDYRKVVENTKVSAIVISNRFKEKSVENLKRLSQQLNGHGEIIFVNNGAPDSEFETLIEYVNTYVKTKGNSGAYLARNLGSIFAKGEYLLFVDDDGIPDDGFVDGHLEVQNNKEVIAARGSCYSGNGNDPKHYYLGDEIKSAPLYLEGNTSIKADRFYHTNGWGDYILFGHGGMELSYRLIEAGVDYKNLIYTPNPRLKHAYSSSEKHLHSKVKKQKNSYLLLLSRNKGLERVLNVWNNNANNTKTEFTTPSEVVKVEPHHLKNIGLSDPIYIPKGEVHRIGNIFTKHEYRLPRNYQLPQEINVLDIGANVGIFALYASKWAERVNIHCFEPNPQVHPLLEMNTKNLGNVYLKYHALGNSNGELVLNQHPVNTGQTSTTLTFENGKKVNVPVLHSGEVISRLKLNTIDVVKIDTEGAEIQILEGLKDHIPNIKILMAEYHTEHDRKRIEELLPEFMLYSAHIEELRGVGTVKYINTRFL